jgi:RNA polymerase sigma factor (sigma-70 family)
MTDYELKLFWDNYYPKVFGFFFKRVQNVSDVEDLTSLIMTQILQKLADQHEIENLHSYLWRMCRYKLYDYINQKKNLPNLVELKEYDDDGLLTSPQSTYKIQAEEILKFAKSHIKDDEYIILEMNLIQEFNSTEIGQKLNIKANTVRQKLKRIIHKLQKHKHLFKF